MKTCPNEDGCHIHQQQKKFDDTIMFCQMCGTKLEKHTAPIKRTLYLHRDKDSNYDLGDELRLNDEAMEVFAYAGYEVGLDCRIHTETGKVFATGIKKGGKVIPLEEDVEI